MERRLKGTRREPGARELVSQELIERCRAGDQRAWEELVDSTHREVYTLCLRILRNPDDAADATQDAYVKVWRGLKAFRGEALFSTWLYRVAANSAISKHRARRRRRARESHAEDEILERVAAAGSTEEKAGLRLELRDLEAAIAALPEHYRLPVVLRDVYGLSMEDIARELRISETAAKVRVHRARKRLKQTVFGTETELEA